MVKLNKIYTRTGDKGKTSLVDGKKRLKSDLRIEAYGTIDEANAVIGLARLHTSGSADKMLAKIQNELFDLGADLATPGHDFTPDEKALRIVDKQVSRLENEIDEINKDLQPLRSFILPGGCPASAYLHLARTIVRRAERHMVELMQKEAVNPAALKYINRLSDHLFVLGRHLNQSANGDVLWQPGATRG